MKFEKIVLGLFLTAVPSAVYAQNERTVSPSPTPTAQAAPPQTTGTSAPNTQISRERREQAIAKLLEGQRFLWTSLNAGRPPTQAAKINNMKLAKAAFKRAVELDSSLAEAYTALAELAITAPPTDLEEAILLASVAVKIEPRNFGAQRILARLFTFKSRLNNGVLDASNAARAIEHWRAITGLDPRNAEAWAFLSEFYDKTNKPEERIKALRNWVSATPAIETQFFQRVLNGQGTLSTETASLKLAGALKKQGETREAIAILSQLVADDADNPEAIELLGETIETADTAAALTAVESLQQAVYANPSNSTLISMLAQIQARSGKIDDAARVLRDSAAKLSENDKIASANLQVSLGDLFAGANRVNESAAAYQTALSARGIEASEPATDEQREFAVAVFEKMIRLYKNANRPNDVRTVIERARKVLGKDDLFADRQLISFYRETGKKPEALEAVRAVRTRLPEDYGFLNLEATLLTENGKVDDAVKLVKDLIEKRKLRTVTKNGDGTGVTGTVQQISQLEAGDDFSNYLFISELYTKAGRGKESIDAANQAYLSAQGAERKQIAKLALATAQQMGGDFGGAESTLREILKQMPDNPIALNNLGYFLIERDVKLTEAMEMIRKAVEIDPTNPSYLDSLGWAHYKLGNYEEAEKHLRSALRYDSSATILEHLGDVLQKRNKPQDAKNAWQKALMMASDAKDIARLKTKVK